MIVAVGHGDSLLHGGALAQALELTAGGELIVAGRSGNGYRLAELMAANNPSDWSRVVKVKTLDHPQLYPAVLQSVNWILGPAQDLPS